MAIDPVQRERKHGFALLDRPPRTGTLEALLNDVARRALGTRSFTVVTPMALGSVMDVQKQRRLADFPHPGDRLTLQWSDLHQNFRLVTYRSANETVLLNTSSPFIVGAGPGDDLYRLDIDQQLASGQQRSLTKRWMRRISTRPK